MRVERVLTEALNSPDELPNVVMNGPADRVLTDTGKTNSPVIHENTQRRDGPEWRVTVQIMESGGLFLKGSSLRNPPLNRFSRDGAGSWTSPPAE